MAALPTFRGAGPKRCYLHLKGFTKMSQAFGPQFVARLSRSVGKKNVYLAKFAEARLRRQIQSGKNQENAALTIIMKGSSKPLINFGTLLKSVSSSHWTPYSFSVGVTNIGKGKINVPAILESGAVVPVTPLMRKFFWAKFMETKGKVLPLKASTTQIIIPPRPFLKTALVEDAAFIQVIYWEWMHAIREAFGPVTGL